MRDLRIVFMGTPDFAVGVLKSLVDAGEQIVGVITTPDKPAGRGRMLRESAVKAYATKQGLRVLQPINLKDEAFLDELKTLGANLQIVVAFRMLPKVVWALPDFGTFNLHASLLPDYRGAAPINWAVINGEVKTGVTTFFIDEKIDTGAIIANREVAIETKETAGSLHDKLMEAGSGLVLETVKLIREDRAIPKPQPMDGDWNPAPKLHSENTQIDWTWNGNRLEAFVRGLSPYPSAWTVLINNAEETKVKIYSANFEKVKHDDTPGKITATKKSLQVSVLDGYLYIKVMQLPGKRKMEVSDLLNGYIFEADAKFV
ncbi:MAG: methionyl-tRNA formyltransferase [Flavobacteriaceae bacterium]|nr:methionyl-tRNA formyltransferase [Flavobacteriaceae bacterium]